MTTVDTRVAQPRADFRIDARTRDHVLVTLWFVSTFKQFPYDELILYPVALYFAWAFVRDFNQLFPLLRRSLILFAFPFWWLLASAWGTDTGAILRSGAQMTLTMIICYCAVLRLDQRQIVISMLVSAGVFGVLSLLSDGSGGVAARGVFTSKNAMGAAMVILWIAALCVTLDGRFRLLVRVGALCLMAISAQLIVVSNSATAQLIAMGATCVILVIGVLGGRGIGHPQFVIPICAFIAVGLLGSAFLLSTREVDPIASILGFFGKDPGLTGRVDLWDYAIAEIRRNPWLGVGPGGFWTPLDWTSDARRIYIDYHKAFYSSFSFHNAYLEITVHLGLIGLGLAVLTIGWVFKTLALEALRNPAIPSVFFLSIGLVKIARSTTESVMMAPFSLMTMIMVIGALFVVKDCAYPTQTHTGPV